MISKPGNWNCMIHRTQSTPILHPHVCVWFCSNFSTFVDLCYQNHNQNTELSHHYKDLPHIILSLYIFERFFFSGYTILGRQWYVCVCVSVCVLLFKDVPFSASLHFFCWEISYHLVNSFMSYVPCSHLLFRFCLYFWCLEFYCDMFVCNFLCFNAV